jgi:hypothetical protein
MNKEQVFKFLENPAGFGKEVGSHLKEHIISYFKECKNKPSVEISSVNCDIAVNLAGGSSGFLVGFGGTPPLLEIFTRPEIFLEWQLSHLRDRPLDYALNQAFSQRILTRVFKGWKNYSSSADIMSIKIWFPEWEVSGGNSFPKFFVGKLKRKGNDLEVLLKSVCEYYIHIDKYYLDSLLQIESYLISKKADRFTKKDLKIVRGEISRMKN